MQQEDEASRESWLSKRLWLAGLALGCLYWIIESLADTVVHAETFAERLWPADPNELWMRFSLVAVLVAGGAGAQYLIRRRRRAETLARESEARTRTILETAPDAIVTATREGVIASFNRGAERMFGYRTGEVVGSPLSTLMPERLREAHGRGLRRYLETGEARVIGRESVELAGLRKSGEEFPLELALGESRDGESIVFTGVMRDITERKAAEQREAEWARRALLQAETGAALGEGGTLRETLQRCAEIAFEHLDTAFFRIWTINEKEQVLELKASAGQYTHLDGPHGRIKVGELKIGLIASEREPHLTNDVLSDPRIGDREWARREGMVSFAGYPLVAEGRLVGVMATFARRPLADETLEALSAIAYDIAQGIERKRAEEALREAERRFRGLIQNAADLIAIEDREGVISYVSPSVERILGYPPEEVVGSRPREYIHPDDRPEAAEAFAEAISGPGLSSARTLRYLHRDGSWRYLEVACNNQLHDPVLSGLVFNCRDVTEREMALRALGEREQRLAEAQRLAALGSFEWDIERDVVAWSEQMYRILGLTPEKAGYLSYETYANKVHPDDRAGFESHLRESLKSSEYFEFEHRILRPGGEERIIQERGEIFRNAGGEPVRLVGTGQDVTERRRAELELRNRDARYRSVVETAREAIVTMSGEGLIESFNPAAAEIFGYNAGEAVGQPVTLLMPERFREAHEAGLARYLSTGAKRMLGETIELAGLRKSGEEFPLELSLAVAEVADAPTFTGIMRDITDRKATERLLEHQALHDPLTDLPNRTLFTDRLEHALQRARRSREPVTVLYLDLDNFKMINDSLGHDFGDKMLTRIAARLKDCLRPEDTLARMGGDEFTALLEDAEDASQIAERILETARGPLVVEGHELPVTASLGIATSFGEESPKDLIRHADAAMYRAKSRGKDYYEIYTPHIDSGNVERLELTNDLRRAVERGELRLHYEEKVCVSTGEVAGWEALLRWEHPLRGLLMPGRFIHLAEETGLIISLGRWALREACRKAQKLGSRHPSGRPLSMHVNLSPKQLRHPDLANELDRLLREAGLKPEALELEITESVLFEDQETAIARLRELRELGVRVALDDFGTGYSSLSSLKHLPLDSVKIDRSFLARLEDDPRDEAFVSTVIVLGHTLGLEVIAEGVERPGQLTRLRELGCDYAQGYYFSKPLSEASSM